MKKGNARKSRALSCTEQHLAVLKTLLRREGRPRKTISKAAATSILEAALSAREHLSPELIREIGTVLSKTDGIEQLAGVCAFEDGFDFQKLSNEQLAAIGAALGGSSGVTQIPIPENELAS